jgi:hypothetical protein
MSVQVLTNCKLYVDQFDWSGRTSKLGLSYGARGEDATAFGNDTENFLPGRKLFKAAHEMLVEYGTGLDDEQLFQRVDVNDTVMTVGPLTGAESEPAYFGQIIVGRYAPGAVQGKVLRASLDVEASGPLLRGVVGANRTAGSSSTGPVIQQGAVLAGQSMWAALHVQAISGSGTPTLTVTLKSAATSGFGSPTNRISFAGQTALGAVWGTPAPGAITDQYWRVDFTISGTTPSFTFVVVFGID